ncbi:hypothetical protein Tco_0116805 [Tanacetum coccineum]
MEFLIKRSCILCKREGIRHERQLHEHLNKRSCPKDEPHSVEAARTMLSAAKVSLFFRDEAIATTCFTPKSVHLYISRHEKTPTISSMPKTSKINRVFNKRTRIIVETIHVNFDELPPMALDHVGSDPGAQCSTTILEQDSLSPGLQSQENVSQVAETETTSNELELLYSLMISELLNGTSPVVSKSFVVNAADNPDKR